MGLKKDLKKAYETLEKLEEIMTAQNAVIEYQRKTISYLEKKFREMEVKLREVQDELDKRNPKPDFVKEDVEQEPKKTGQKKGHKGYTRHIPERIDEVKEHTLDKCPKCGGEVSETQETRERVITDIPKTEAKNTKHIIHRCYCKNCKKNVEPEVEDALPNARFGLRLMLLVLIMKLDSRIPSNKITPLLEMLFNLKISDGEVYVILEQLSKAFGSYYDELVEKIKEALVKNIDETSWRTNGKNRWLWIFINKEVALFAIRKKRSSEVPKEILGNQEGKTTINDRLEAYNQLSKDSGSVQQICWTHLLRNSKDLAEHHKEAKYIHKRMRYIYKKAKEGKTLENKLLYWIDLIGSRVYTSHEVFKFVKAICRKHRENLFRFVNNPEIDPTNDLAERGLRHPVVIRKISNGNRSDKGAEITERLLSVTQTIKMNHSNPMDAMIGLLQNTK
jgi:transposase